MNTFFTAYLIGFIITGILYKWLYSNESFREHRIRLIHQVKAEVAKLLPGVNDVDDDTVINHDIVLAMFLSFIGLFVIAVAIIGWKNEDSIL